MTPQEEIELLLLAIMIDMTPDEYRDGYFMPFRFLGDLARLDVEIVRGFMRSMRNRQLVEYGKGFDEDGLTAGAGYTITERGRLHAKALSTTKTLAIWKERHETRVLEGYRQDKSWSQSQ